MGSKIFVGLGEKERKQATLLQDPGAQLCFPLSCHRPEKLFRSLLIMTPTILVLKAAQAVFLKTHLLKHRYFVAVCWGAGHLLGFHSNRVLEVWVNRVLMYFETTID